ncbi:MAG: Xaa-Pro peptidase family protein [Hyphomicrobiaceae bacterium]
MDKHLHFTTRELADRRRKATKAMAEAGLEALLVFRQESMFYLTGYDTFGFVYFQCLVLTADGGMTLLTRAPDLRQAHYTSVIEDVRIWRDREGANPADDLKAILKEKGLKGARLGVEYEAYGLTANNSRRLEASMKGFAKLEDASHLVSRIRLVKSAAEIEYARKAAELADAAWDAAVKTAKPGAFEGDILAAMHNAIFKAGGDYPGNSFIVGSGPGALMCRYYSGRRTLDRKDQLTLEWAGAYRWYHAAMMRTLSIGKPPARQVEMMKAAEDALLACEAALKPGRPIGEVFDAHARVLDAAGLSEHRLNACGYSMGTTYPPNWMDWPMLYNGNPVVAEPGMIFFIHIIIFDSHEGVAATLGRSSLVTRKGSESLSKAELGLIVK